MDDFFYIPWKVITHYYYQHRGISFLFVLEIPKHALITSREDKCFLVTTYLAISSTGLNFHQYVILPISKVV